ncbi:MFS transporter [Tsukamurella sp. 1534]|uniref:spinster family MFS transporter n=1 Tax=Tsukamurella sp. 1534 TaxID=1151061 RepID=UPI0002FEC4B8|nr:MFS transporter [Tsukamurella sp. 1534]
MSDVDKIPEPGAARPLQASNAWGVLVLLFAANAFNFYDRSIPAILNESIKEEFQVSDTAIGLLSASFTVIYALCGIPLGIAADRMSRGRIMGAGLAVWSLLTAATGAAWSFTSLILIRLGVGVGEASYAPAANSMIADLFPANKRARAFGVFQMGLPVGLITAYFSVGAIATAFDSWRAPFFLAAVPGIVLAIAFFLVKEPLRGASEVTQVKAERVRNPMRRILSVRTMWWLIVAGIGANVAAYSVNTFMVPMFMRYFGLKLTGASVLVGIVVGVGGLIGLLLGGWLADRADAKSASARVTVGAIAVLIAAPLTLWALTLGTSDVALFVVVFSVAWTLQYLYYTSAYPTIADVVEPRLRSTAVAVFFAAFYLLGGGLGPVIVGMISDHFAASAQADGLSEKAALALGLRDSLLWVVPTSLVISAIGLFGASRTVTRDNAAMRAQLTAAAA